MQQLLNTLTEITFAITSFSKKKTFPDGDKTEILKMIPFASHFIEHLIKVDKSIKNKTFGRMFTYDKNKSCGSATHMAPHQVCGLGKENPMICTQNQTNELISKY